MDPEKIMSGISDEILTILKTMKKVKIPNEKLIYSETIKNLCDSLNTFFDLMALDPYDNDDDYENDDDNEQIPF